MKQVKTENKAVYTAKAPLIDEEAILEQARSIIKQRFSRLSDAISHPSAVVDYLSLTLSKYDSEVFGLLLLDSQHRVINDSILFKGSIDSCSVYPRDILKTVLAYNSAAVIVYHNHPSGTIEPSASDHNITKVIKEALYIVDVRLLDHIIIGGLQSYSFVQHGLI